MHRQLTPSLAEELHHLGYTEGAPSHIPPTVVAADMRIYRVQRCGECGSRGHKVIPFHRGRQYRLVCSCRKCGSEMEA
ncbi:MAG TPA: hypothetical protein VMG10_27380 [Gemmataceae bacterium]|nr:hypothetical protein [Gemmataceae bacterium]